MLRHFRLSQNRNSKRFDRRKRDAAPLSHEEALYLSDSWADNRVWLKRDGVGANDDQRRRRDVPISDLLEVV